jgi:hypothetical protein
MALTTACVRFAASSLSRIGVDASTFLPPHKDAGGFARRIMDLSVQCSARNMQEAADGGASGERQRILGLLATLWIMLTERNGGHFAIGGGDRDDVPVHEAKLPAR